jgi:hypothetical protein
MAFGPCRVRPEHISEEWSEESSGDGYWISLRPGWSLSDDAVHCIHEYTKTEAHRRFIRRCDCKSCRFWEPAS